MDDKPMNSENVVNTDVEPDREQKNNRALLSGFHRTESSRKLQENYWEIK